MKENKQSGAAPEQNGVEESTKGFPVVTEQDEANAASFEMKKRNPDGSWVAATPVHVTDGGAEPAAEEQSSAQEPETAAEAEPAEAVPEEPVKEPESAAPEAAEPEEEPEDEPEEEVSKEGTQRKKSKGKRIAAVVAGAAAVVVIGFSAYVYSYGGIFPGVRVADSYKLSGMTQEEAQSYIAGEVQNGIFDKEIKLTGKDLGTDSEKE